MREARSIAALNHPNIASIYEIGEADGAPVLVLEYIPGETLRARISAGPLPLAEIVRFGLQIAEGLGYAHSHGPAHGDVKPENMMFAEDGRLKITDFGLARVYDDRTVTVDGKISGTLSGTSRPNAFKGGRQTARWTSSRLAPEERPALTARPGSM